MRTTASALSTPSTAKIIRILTILGFTFATAIAAQIRFPIPGNAVPVTLQTAIVLLAALRLGARDGAISQVLYLVGGALGLPFFSNALGLAVLMGPTGGYLIGFVLAAYVLGRVESRCTTYTKLWLATFAASLVLFVPGVIQLKLVLGLGWSEAVMMGFVPFLIGDVLKVTMTASTHWLFRKRAA